MQCLVNGTRGRHSMSNVGVWYDSRIYRIRVLPDHDRTAVVIDGPRDRK
jgi:hypothetical protein